MDNNLERGEGVRNNEITLIKNELDRVLGGCLGDINSRLKKYRGRVFTDRQKTDPTLTDKDFYGLCGSYAS